MIELSSVAATVAAPAGEIWALITDFGQPQRLARTIERCTVTGSGVGSVRTVHARGLEIHERLIQADTQNYRFRYEALPTGDMPAPGLTSYLATVVLAPLGPALTQIQWSSKGDGTFDVAHVRKTFDALYLGAIANIQHALTRGSDQNFALNVTP